MAATDKYDRQLRLWGANGQRALMESKICLLNAGPTGTETLKNLVLPGCGYICVVDSATVTERDCANNFFVTRDHIGQPRAKVTMELLTEMNPDVTGAFREDDPRTLLTTDPAFFDQFTLVVATQLPIDVVSALSSYLDSKHVALLAVRSYGLLGTVRICRGEHWMVESKPENTTEDLRLGNPFPALRAFVDEIGPLEALDDMTHKHVPYVALLVRALDAWKAANGGLPPSTTAQKSAFRASLHALERPSLAGNEDNIVEAVSNAPLAFYKTAADAIHAELQDVLDDPALDSLSPASHPFWFLARAVKDFVAAHGALPLSGDLPDMTATTDLYIALQKVYAAQAEADRGTITARVRELESSVGAAPGSLVTDEFIKAGCKNARYLRLKRFHGVAGEAAVDEVTKEGVTSAIGEATALLAGPALEQAPVLWYAGLRAADAFCAKHGRYPGETDATLDADAAEVLALGKEFLSASGVDEEGVALFTEKHAKEIARYGAGEIHATAAYIGGVAAQEAVKLVTRQYIPADNTLLYNGIAGVSATLKL